MDIWLRSLYWFLGIVKVNLGLECERVHANWSVQGNKYIDIIYISRIDKLIVKGV